MISWLVVLLALAVTFAFTAWFFTPFPRFWSASFALASCCFSLNTSLLLRLHLFILDLLQLYLTPQLGLLIIRVQQLLYYLVHALKLFTISKRICICRSPLHFVCSLSFIFFLHLFLCFSSHESFLLWFSDVRGWALLARLLWYSLPMFIRFPLVDPLLFGSFFHQFDTFFKHNQDLFVIVDSRSLTDTNCFSELLFDLFQNGVSCAFIEELAVSVAHVVDALGIEPSLMLVQLRLCIEHDLLQLIWLRSGDVFHYLLLYDQIQSFNELLAHALLLL